MNPDAARGGGAAHARAVAALAFPFLLDQLSVGLGGLTPLDALVVMAINQANIVPLTRNPEARRRYGALDAPAPDAQRRPVSISSAASSLQLPFETVRRHVRLLTELGACAMVDGGVIVPESFLTSASYCTSVVASHARLQRFCADLQAAGLAGPPPPSGFPREPQAPVRAAARLLSDYILRSSEALMRLAGELTPALVLLALLAARLERDGAPTRARALAGRLQIPEETVRRHVRRMVERGICRTSPQGLLLREAMLVEPAWRSLLQDNAANVQRLFAGLAERGVIEAWRGADESL